MNRILAALAGVLSLAACGAPAYAQVSDSDFLAKAQALVTENAALKAENAKLKAPPVVVAPAPPSPVTLTPLPLGAKDTFLGQAWTAQTDRVQVGSDGSRRFSAYGGQNAPSFDIPKKIRTELVGSQRFAKGEVMELKGELFVEPGGSVDWAQWLSVLQVHQADSRYADGRAVNASPPFAADITVGPDGKEYLQVRGETAKPGDLLRDLKPDGTYAYRFAPLRVLGKTSIQRGVWLPFHFRMVDSHGAPGGSIFFKLGDVVVTDFTGPTGYGYVDDLASVIYGGRVQDTRSYLKLGIYGGNSALASIPADKGAAVRFRPAP